jgi:uncharacterized protein YjiS (DUF1127 family)
MTHSHNAGWAPLAGSTTSSAPHGVLGLLDRLILRPLVALHRGRVARRELMALDDRELADIGLHRSQIEMAVSQPWRIVGQSPQISVSNAPANLNRRTASAA